MVASPRNHHCRRPLWACPEAVSFVRVRIAPSSEAVLNKADRIATAMEQAIKLNGDCARMSSRS